MPEEIMFTKILKGKYLKIYSGFVLSQWFLSLLPISGKDSELLKCSIICLGGGLQHINKVNYPQNLLYYLEDFISSCTDY